MKSNGHTTNGEPGAELAAVPETNWLFNGSEVKILVLDDDPAVGRLIQAALGKNDLNVEAVSDPTMMERPLRNQKYHVIILDYIIPGLDSQRMLDLIRDFQPEASVIVVTAFPTIDSAVLCLRSHTYDYIPKPFEIDLLKRTVMRCLENRGLLRLSEEALREQLGGAIRERRKALGLTLAEMAKRTSVSLGYLSQIELGKNSASIETLYRIALGLRIRVADLFQSVQPPM